MLYAVKLAPSPVAIPVSDKIARVADRVSADPKFPRHSQQFVFIVQLDPSRQVILPCKSRHRFQSIAIQIVAVASLMHTPPDHTGGPVASAKGRL